MGKEKTSMLKVKGSTFRAMEDTLEKLRCLNYEQLFLRRLKQRAISRDEFILPAKNTGMQFNLYIELIKWLLSLISTTTTCTNSSTTIENNESKEASRNFQNVDVFDDPNVIAQMLMLSLRDLDYEIDFPITMLKQPHGEIATSILNFLTDKALQSQNYKFEVEPIYVSEKSTCVAESQSYNEQEKEELIETDEETFEESTDSIALYNEEITNNGGNNDDYHDNHSITSNIGSHDIIKSDIDPMAWRAELERVSPELEIHFDALDINTGTSLGRSWRAQVSKAFFEQQKVVLEMECSKDAFQRLSKESNRTLEMIGVKEQIINEKFKKTIDEYNYFNDKLSHLVENRNVKSCHIDELKAEGSLLSKRLEEIKMKVDEKGNRMTDTGPLLKIKATLKEIKAEIQEYDLQIGILEHNLLHRRISKGNVH